MRSLAMVDVVLTSFRRVGRVFAFELNLACFWRVEGALDVFLACLRRVQHAFDAFKAFSNVCLRHFRACLAILRRVFGAL